mgnify:CR=1 FL=1
MPLKITILGLGQVGASIGLALAKIKDQAVRVGNDREPMVMRQAEKIGAVDRTMINLPSAVKDADLVIMALPIDEIHDTIEVIAQDLKSGAVLIDTSPIKSAVMQWAKELLPGDDRYFVTLNPSLNPAYLDDVSQDIDEAHADLFQNSLMLITTPMGIDNSAIELVTNLTQILGATPLFTDAVEADGLNASSNLLPRLVAAALVNATVDQPGWREARKLAGAAYAQSTELVLHPEETKALGQAALLNADNAIRVLGVMMEELQSMREAIAANDATALQQRLEHARDAREEWITHRMAANWEPRPDTRLPSGGEMIGKLFGIRPSTRKDKGGK